MKITNFFFEGDLEKFQTKKIEQDKLKDTKS